MAKINTPKKRRCSAWLLLSIMLFEILMPTFSYALTSGPSAPEVQSFTPIDHSQMVDLFTGDFSYNIPLFELPGPNGGYPFNLAYSSSGVTMDTEASWVGLGWSLNPGAINRQMRGLPDDFKGDEVLKEVDIKKNWTIGSPFRGNFELFGASLSSFLKRSSFTTYYNNQKGLGFTMSANQSFGVATKSGLGANLGIGLKLDSQKGFSHSLSPSISIPVKIKNYKAKFDLGANYNSKRGLEALSLMSTHRFKFLGKSRNLRNLGKQFSFEHATYIPNASLPITNLGISFKIKTGLGTFGAFPNLYIDGWYQEQKIAKNNKAKSYKAIGYIYAESADSVNMVDINREKDGVLRKNSPNIGIPHFTADSYAIQGQGVGGMFRAYRNDIGILHDAESKVHGGSGSFGFDAGPPAHGATDFSLNYTFNKNGVWNQKNEIKKIYDFKTGTNGSLYEPYYFKMIGESTTEPLSDIQDIGGENPLRVRVKEKDRARGETKKVFENNDRKQIAVNAKRIIRKPRGQTILALTNEELLNPTLNKVALKELAYLDTQGNDVHQFTADLSNAKANKGHHIGAFQILTLDGMRYNYGLPVYNREQIEEQFSMEYDKNESFETTKQDLAKFAKQSQDGRILNYKAADTEEFNSRTVLPAYTTSHLITNILGHDYIDIDNNGPSDEDYGYWVKFQYKKHENYKWRAPFVGVNNLPGHFSKLKINDDKGAYLYGERENYILDSVETKTHKAIFYSSPRKDGRGAYQEIQSLFDTNNDKLGAYAYKLDSIKLLSKAQSDLPIKVVHFDYNYSLCPGVWNNGDSEETGKLTLEKVWFTYQNNTRGALSPYIFNYPQDSNDSNYPYNSHSVDRWGTYRNQYQDNRDLFFPYTKQFDNNGDTTERNQANRNAAAWLLNRIKLPSGGEIKVDYEADDYSKVQDREATQMFKIFGLREYKLGQNPVSIIDSLISNKITGIENNGYRLYFELEKKLPIGTTQQEFKDLYLRNLNKDTEKQNQIFYKILVAMGPDGANKEFVSGYASILNAGLTHKPTSNKSDSLDLGFIDLDQTKIGKKKLNYHPFFLAAVQKRRIELSNLPVFGNYDQFEGSKISGVKNLVKSISGSLALFTGYYTQSWLKGWGQEIDRNYSWIKLNTPDYVKTGGGSRVVKVTMDDQWEKATSFPEIPIFGFEKSAQYGQVYDYLEKDKNGSIIKSYGVAINEPGIGGEESPLNGVKHYPENIPLQSNNNLFFEYPINNAHYPGASVGYEKVCVQTLAASKQKSNTGYSIHEFYTASDFPLFSEETEAIKTNLKPVKIPIPTAGFIEINRLTATQGYSIQLNDMHGKQKKISHYANLKDCLKEANPISWTKYNYNQKTRTIFDPLIKDFKLINIPNEVIEVVTENKDSLDFTKAKTQTMRMGINYDFFTDMRENRNESWTGGLDFNADIIIFGFIPSTWFKAGHSSTEVRIAATNKIIRRSGIMTSVEAFDQGSYITTENLLFDQYTGQPLLTKVNNHYDDPIYNYSTPAYWSYDGMGAAYQNLKLKLRANLTRTSWDQNVKVHPSGLFDSESYAALAEGDEFIISNLSNAKGDNAARAYLIEKCDPDQPWIIHIDSYQNFAWNPTDTVEMLLVRSGRRNHLSTTNASYTSLSNPTINRTLISCNQSEPIVFECEDTEPPLPIDNGDDTTENTTTETFKVCVIDSILNTSAVSFTEFLLPAKKDFDYCATCVDQWDGEIYYEPEAYLTGERGIWRQHETFAYLDDRSQTTAIPNLRKDGIYNNLPMFDFEFVQDFLECQPKWKRTNEITKYDPNSFVLEERDILNNYSAAQYGYRNSLPTAVGYNMENEELFSMDFEELLNHPNYSAHISLYPVWAHSGKYSLLVSKDNSYTLDISPDNFKGKIGKEYIISCWMINSHGNLYPTYYQNNNAYTGIRIDFIGSGSSHKVVKPSGKMIETFQKIEESFVIPAGTESIRLTFQHFVNNQNVPVNFTTYDDLRIFPADGNIQTYVYDPATYRLSAVLDNNNYATKYNYNAAGDLYSVHKETIEGIKTLQAIDYHAPETAPIGGD